jgi:hypothetical protein
MSEVGTAEFLRMAHEAREQVRQNLERLTQARGKHEAARKEITTAASEALVELVSGILASLDPAAVTRAIALTGSVKLAQDGPVQIRAREQKRLEARLAEIEADPRYQNRELLAAPRVGTLSQQIIELVEFRTSLADVLTRAAHERLEHLLQVGYGTAGYTSSWWRLSYYRDWKAGDEILEKFPGKKLFSEVRDEVLTARQTIDVYDQKLRDLRAEVDAIKMLEEFHAKATEDLANLDAKVLADTRVLLAKHVAHADAADLGQRLAAAPELTAVAKRWLGLNQKAAYLEQMQAELVDKPELELRTELSRLERDIAKYSRPKKQWEKFPVDKLQKRFRDRSGSWNKHWQRHDAGFDRVVHFDHYDRGSFGRDFLWWDVMTDGRLDGNFIPEVAEFHRLHPDHRYDRYDDDADARAAAVVADTDRTDTSSPGFVDPS